MQQDELTGLTRIVVKDLAKVNAKEPKLILESEETGLQEIRLPSFTTIEATDGKVASAGDVLARIPQEVFEDSRHHWWSATCCRFV